jgi:hypothetical protein
VVRFVRPAPGLSHVSYAWLAGADAEAVIQAQVDYFDPQGLSFSWFVYEHDRPAGLGERLAARGFEEDEPGVVMVLDLAAAPESLLAPPGADVRAVTARAGLEDVIAVESEVWGVDCGWMRQRLGDHLEIPGYLSVYVAYADGQPACAAWTYFYPNSHFAGLWGGSTVAGQRGRGLYTATLLARAQEAARRGVRFLMVDTTEMSRPIVAKHGFEPLAEKWTWDWTAGGRRSLAASNW